MSSPRSTFLVYSCSGASSAAQMANHLAVRLDRLGAAEMSCIAGVGGNVGPLIRVARSGRPILVLDGCPLHCAARILRRQGIEPSRHCDLSRHGVEKRAHQDFDPGVAARLLDQLLAELNTDGTPASEASGAAPVPQSPGSPGSGASESGERRPTGPARAWTRGTPS